MPKRLLPLSAFDEIFLPLKGSTVMVTEGCGVNPGDLLIYRATEQMLNEHGIAWKKLPVEQMSGQVDHVLLFGGGNLQSPYKNECTIRNKLVIRARQLGIPTTLLPQSTFQEVSMQGCVADRAFVRERESLKLYPGAMLAPDLVLGAVFGDPPAPSEPVGHVFRNDLEGLARKSNYGYRLPPDPVRVSNVSVYLKMCASYEAIYTDRLHVAITGLALGRKVTLVQNAYHKNKSMYDTWLQRLGCEWMGAADYVTKFLKKKAK